MDIRTKKHLISQNILYCKFGIYKTLPIGKTQKNFFSYNFNIAPPYEYCTVDVKSIHILDTAYDYVQNNYNPVILNLVTDDFTGENINSCEGFKDELTFMRTNINQTINGFNLFPLKGTEVIYTPMVHIIRNDNMQILHPSYVRKISVITAALKKDPQMINDNLNLDDYTTTSQLLEVIFQTAHLGGNDVIILNDIGCITNNYPVNDIVDMINGCIYKYGHLFKHIVVSIHVINQAAMGYYAKINARIVRPQAFLNEYMQTNLITNIQTNAAEHDHVQMTTEQNNQIMNSNMNFGIMNPNMNMDMHQNPNSNSNPNINPNLNQFANY